MAPDGNQKKCITKLQPSGSRQTCEVKVSTVMTRMIMAEKQSVVKAKRIGGVDFMGFKFCNSAHNKERIDKNDGGHEYGAIHWQTQVGIKDANERDSKGDTYGIVRCSCCTMVQYKGNQDFINWTIEYDHTQASNLRVTLNLFGKLYMEFLRNDMHQMDKMGKHIR